jgi:prepilin peptidase CpaA
MRPILEYLPLLACLILAAAIDIRTRRIPNWLTVGLILTGFARAFVLWGGAGCAHSFFGLLAGAGPGLVLFALGALGGGDVKLLAGIGVWVGAPAALAIFALQCVIGAGLVVIQAVRQRRLVSLIRNTSLLAYDISHKGLAASAPTLASPRSSSIDQPLPFAVPAALATFVVLLTRA